MEKSVSLINCAKKTEILIEKGEMTLPHIIQKINIRKNV